MIVSSRTPEGWSGRCSVCGRSLRIEPSMSTRDATCPNCGSLVWLSSPAKRGPAALAIRFVAVLGLVVTVWAVLLAAIWSNMGGPEIVTIVVLAFLLFAPKLARFCRWLVRRS